jgi:hypothetical protein
VLRMRDGRILSTDGDAGKTMAETVTAIGTL